METIPLFCRREVKSGPLLLGCRIWGQQEGMALAQEQRPWDLSFEGGADFGGWVPDADLDGVFGGARGGI